MDLLAGMVLDDLFEKGQEVGPGAAGFALTVDLAGGDWCVGESAVDEGGQVESGV